MSIVRVASPVYKLNFWSNNPFTDGPDPEGFERVLPTDTWPELGKGVGALSKIGSFGYVDTVLWDERHQEAADDLDEAGATYHAVLNFLQPGSTGGSVFRIKVPPGDYEVTVKSGSMEPNLGDIVVNRVLFFDIATQGIWAREVWLEVTHTVNARNGLIEVEMGRNDLILDFATLINSVVISPVVYDGDVYPDIVSTEVDPASEADQGLVTALLQRDLALTERPISMEFPATVVASNSFLVARQWNIFVPQYANQLVMEFDVSVSFTPNGSGGLITAGVAFAETDPLGWGTTSNRLVALFGAGSTLRWEQAIRVVNNTSPTRVKSFIDVRNVAGNVVNIALVCQINNALGGNEGLTMTLDGSGVHANRFIFQEGFHDNDVQLLGTATMSATPTYIPKP